MNILHNTGFTKPYEWVKGRKVKVTNGLSEDSTRALTGTFDPVACSSSSRGCGRGSRG